MPIIFTEAIQLCRKLALPSDSTVSILALQSVGGFASFITRNGYQMHLAAVGNRSADELIARQRKDEVFETWFWRGVGPFLMYAGVALILMPLSIIAAVVPVLGWIVRGTTGVLAIGIALVLSALVIALAWLGISATYGWGPHTTCYGRSIRPLAVA